jgi:hypothetical protein
MDKLGARIFTVEEANRLIPYLEASLETLSAMAREIGGLQRELDVLAAISGTGVTRENPDVKEFRDKQSRQKDLVDRYRALLSEVAGHGCILRDLDVGLVDFYTTVRDRIVCLCWRRGEAGIGYWHPMDQGFSGRRPLSELS